MKAVLIDGPFRGQVVDVPNSYAYVIQMPVPAADGPDTAFGLDRMQVATYHISRVRLFGELLLAGSVKYPPSDYDVFDLLASDLAKDAVRG